MPKELDLNPIVSEEPAEDSSKPAHKPPRWLGKANSTYVAPYDLDDHLARRQTLSEQAVYRQLYRHSHGHGRETVAIGQTDLANRCGVRSKKTIQAALRGLIQKNHIELLQEGAGDPTQPTKFKVIEPRFILED